MKISFGSILLLAALSMATQAADWPHWRGPDANGVSTETGWQEKWPADGPKQLWKVKVGTGFASLAVSQGRVYTMGNVKDTDTVFCFDAVTGREVWHFSYPSKLSPNMYEGGPNATPTVDEGRVYVFSKQGLVHCLDATNGGVIWSKNPAEELKAEQPQWGFAGSVLVQSNLCVLNLGAAGAALDKQTGKVVWSSTGDKAGYATPVPFSAGGEKAVILFNGENALAVRVKDGKELWRYPWATDYGINAADPVVSGTRVFLSSGYNHGAAVIDVADNQPKLIWANKNMRNQFNSSVLLNGYLYGMDDNRLRCLAFETGEVKWSEPSTGKGSLVAADGKLIVLGERGELLVAPASPMAFAPNSRAQVLGGKCWTAPVLANGRIYCRNAAGDVVCLDVAGK